MNPQFRRLNLALVCFTVSICVLSSCTVHEKPPLVTAPQMPTSPQTLPSAGAVATEEEKPTVNETAVTALNSGQLIPSYSLFGGKTRSNATAKSISHTRDYFEQWTKRRAPYISPAVPRSALFAENSQKTSQNSDANRPLKRF